ncbi:Sir2 family NAD-dependent protein deacetylase [Demequina sp. TTPB684]|uniref:SIR2 family NAD-dependent protein deacylase n=1 Tax=unclassified Demequina TaxID=2620311 RepID=UPI001CF1F91D|nr:Sir2 family NAD-dependent protein deacetylase [Demequina sp. TMPB413]MCB2412289.1 Sir2 family NAD-dependent protein deacetylase [Demequina sp. TTPB684]UPU87569.1 Sir2 family NAD-dependent protein deacetylase [Demequina sp. TMPB413]
MPSQRIAVLTGAGISTGSGIPDFRGPAGVWTLNPERARLLDIDAFVRDREVRIAGWRDWRDHPAWTSSPSAAHKALARLADAGRLDVVLTQNFDGLHQAGGLAESDVVEMHGTLRTTSCRGCGNSVNTADVVAGLAANPDPACVDCGGVLKPDIVYFGEILPAAAIDRAVRAATTCDVFIAIGTSLSVYPVASLAGMAVEAGADLIIVTAEPTDYDRYASEVIRGPIDLTVPALVNRLVAPPLVH